MVARVSEEASKTLLGSARGVGIDLGRHRAFAGAAAHSFGHPIPLSNQHDGLLIRWVGVGGPQRVTERILDLAGVRQDEASAFVALVAEKIRRGLPVSIPDRPPETSLAIRSVAIPASFGPLCRQAVVDGFQRAGAEIGHENLVERPIAALAGWFAHRRQISGHPQRDPVLLIDNDGGELSAVIADPLTRRLLICAPLSTGPGDVVEDVVLRLREVITAAAGLLHRTGVVQPTDWASISATLPQVVVTGSGHNHPAMTSLVHGLIPAADVMPDPLVTDPAGCVVLGLQHLDYFASWRACWPTAPVRVGDTVVVDQGQFLHRQDESFIVSPGAELTFGTIEHPLDIRAGSVRASSLVVPNSIGPLPILQLLSDGRMTIRGERGIRPLTVHLSWPCPGVETNQLRLATIGRRAATLN